MSELKAMGGQGMEPSRIADPQPGWDHFRTFGFEPVQPLDRAELDHRLLTLSRRLHPDHKSDPGTKARAIVLIAQLNEAYAVLSDGIRRSDYLLNLLGGPTASECKAVPSGFLEEMMDLRDELESVLEAKDPRKIEGLRETLLAGEKQAEQAIAVGFKALDELRDDDAQRPPLQSKIRESLNMSSYYRSLHRDLDGTR